MAITRSAVVKILALPIVLVVGAELILQVGALIVAATGRDMPVGWSTDNTHVLAVGDSNTFGIYLEEAESYPAQLEKRWNEQHPENQIEVANLGYPGTNSYRVAGTIEDVLQDFQPDVVLLTVGINDIFTASEYVEGGLQPGESVDTLDPVTLIRRYSRLHKLLYIANQGVTKRDAAAGTDDQAFTAADPKVNKRELLQWSDDSEERLRGVKKFKKANSQNVENSASSAETITYGGKSIVMISAYENSTEPEREKGFHHIQANLAMIDDKVKQNGAALYLMTYAASTGFYGATNKEVIRYAAINAEVNFIDVAADIKKICPNSGRCSDLFFEDLHPRAGAYRQVAATVAARLERDKAIKN